MPVESDEQPTAAVRGLLTGGLVLLSIGGMISVVGGLAVTAAAVRATRFWVRGWEEPPKVIAQRRLAQARSAAVAGARGWQNGYQAAKLPS